MNLTAKDFIDYYHLQPHPEGGWYKETYRASESVPQSGLPGRFEGNRSFSTAIYFLLEKGNFSQFHRIKSDECWHFYAGQTLYVYILDDDSGELQRIDLGSNCLAGETFQYVVPANRWFASIPAEDSSFSFAGCTVAPGFDFADFELAKKDDLLLRFPQHSEIISKLTRE
jgi:predicted cupin superfamily sugar epimerase|eukprot:gene2963-3150_t